MDIVDEGAQGFCDFTGRRQVALRHIRMTGFQELFGIKQRVGEAQTSFRCEVAHPQSGLAFGTGFGFLAPWRLGLFRFFLVIRRTHIPCALGLSFGWCSHLLERVTALGGLIQVIGIQKLKHGTLLLGIVFASLVLELFGIGRVLAILAGKPRQHLGQHFLHGLFGKGYRGSGGGWFLGLGFAIDWLGRCRWSSGRIVGVLGLGLDRLLFGRYKSRGRCGGGQAVRHYQAPVLLGQGFLVMAEDGQAAQEPKGELAFQFADV